MQLLSKCSDKALRAGNVLFSIATLGVGLLLLTPALYFLVLQPEQPSWASMEQACRDAAAMNNASPSDPIYLSQCMDGWVISNNLFAPLAAIMMLALGVIITMLGFWRAWKLLKRGSLKNA